jgi:integrase
MRSTGEIRIQRAKIKCEAMARLAEESAKPNADRKMLERIVNDNLRRLGQAPVEIPTVREWLQKWLENERPAIAPATLYKYEHLVRSFLASLGGRANLRLSAILSEDVVAFRNFLSAGGRSPRTVNLQITMLKRPFKIAVETGLIERNPVAMVRGIRGRSSIKGTFTPEQISQVLAVADDEWKGLILAGWFTGGRLGDLARLQWWKVSARNDRPCLPVRSRMLGTEMPA